MKLNRNLSLNLKLKRILPLTAKMSPSARLSQMMSPKFHLTILKYKLNFTSKKNFFFSNLQGILYGNFSKSFTRNMNLEEPHLNTIRVKIQTLLFPVFIGIIQNPHYLYITKICINYIRNRYM